ncbi:MAG: hypothetical protein QM817_31960 [Archangium sp.]
MRRLALAVSGLLFACGGPGGGPATKWTKVAALPNDASPICILVDGDSIFVGHSQGIAKTTDDGATWAASDLKLSLDGGAPIQTEFMAFSGTTLLAGGEATFSSTDHGVTWRAANTGMPNTVSVYTFFTTGTTTLAGMNASSGPMGGVFRTTNKGMTWSASATGLGMNTGVNSFERVGQTIFASAGETIGRSTDEGVTWQTSPTKPGMSNTLWLETLEGILYIATANSGVYSSGDGVVFTAVSQGLPPNKGVSSLFVNDGKIYASVTGAGVFVTADKGASWTAFNEGFTGLPRVIQFAVHGKKLFAVTEPAGVWVNQL